MRKPAYPPVAPNPRYIRLDGREWGMGALKGIFNRTSAKTSVAMIFTATAAAFAYNPATAFVIGGSTIALSILSELGTTALDRIVMKRPHAISPLDYAIDRTGRSTPPENEATLLLETIYAQKKAALAVGVAGSIAITSIARGIPVLMTMDPRVAIAVGVTYAIAPTNLLTHYVGVIRRSQKLLNFKGPRYNYCARPPLRQPEKVPVAMGAKAFNPG